MELLLLCLRCAKQGNETLVWNSVIVALGQNLTVRVNASALRSLGY